MSTPFAKNVLKYVTEGVTTVTDEYDMADEGSVQLISKIIETVADLVVKNCKPKAVVTRARSSSDGSSGKKKKRAGNSYAMFYSRCSKLLKDKDSKDEDCEISLTHQGRDMSKEKLSEKMTTLFEEKISTDDEFTSHSSESLRDTLRFVKGKLDDLKAMQLTSIVWRLYVSDEERKSFAPTPVSD